jgi:hypothetical protein
VFWCAPGDDGADLVPALDPTSFEHDAGVLLVGHANTNYYDAETSSTAAAEQQEHEQEEAAAAVGGGGDDADDDYGHHDLVFEYTSPDGKSFRLMRELRGYERALTRGMARLDRMHEVRPPRPPRPAFFFSVLYSKMVVSLGQRNANAWKQWRAVFGPGSGHDPIWTGDGR